VNVQYLVSGAVIVGVAVVAVLVLWPVVIGNPPYYANVKVGIGKEGLQSGNWVQIEDVTFEKKHIDISLGGWKFGFLQDDRGTLRIDSLQGSVIVDSTVLTWEISRTEISKTYTGTVKLGPPGSGDYTIKATIFPEGEATKEDSRVVGVPEN